jgi:hypothetical protein
MQRVTLTILYLVKYFLHKPIAYMLLVSVVIIRWKSFIHTLNFLKVDCLK